MAEDLSKLNVAQLKALCKEKKITGYSKLGKNALLQKLAEAGGQTLPSAVKDHTATPAQQNVKESLNTNAAKKKSTLSNSRSAIASQTPQRHEMPLEVASTATS